MLPRYVKGTNVTGAQHGGSVAQSISKETLNDLCSFPNLHTCVRNKTHTRSTRSAVSAMAVTLMRGKV